MNALKTAVRTRLMAEAALTNFLAGTASVYHALAPMDANLDYLVFTIAADTPTNQTPTDETEYLVDVIAWSDSGYDATAIREQVDAAMETALIVMGHSNVLQWKERGIPQRLEPEGSQVYYSEGSTFRVRLQG